MGVSATYSSVVLLDPEAPRLPVPGIAGAKTEQQPERGDDGDNSASDPNGGRP